VSYLHLVDDGNDEDVLQGAIPLGEEKQLLKAGFDNIITTPENLTLFKKRK
jgi:hypothetical protein